MALKRGLHSTSGAALVCALALLTLAGCGGDSTSGPAISGSPVTQAQVGRAYSFTPATRSTGSGAESFSISNKPAWATFSIATGQLSGTPTSADVGTYADVVISVSNGTTSRALAPFTIVVVQSTGSGTATLSWTAPTVNTDGSPLVDLGGYTIDYGTDPGALNQTVTISSASATTYTLQGLSPGTWYFAIVAVTTGGSESPLSNVVSTTIS